jgi:hypothetical protein
MHSYEALESSVYTPTRIILKLKRTAREYGSNINLEQIVRLILSTLDFSTIANHERVCFLESFLETRNSIWWENQVVTMNYAPGYLIGL